MFNLAYCVNQQTKASHQHVSIDVFSFFHIFSQTGMSLSNRKHKYSLVDRKHNNEWFFLYKNCNQSPTGAKWIFLFMTRTHHVFSPQTNHTCALCWHPATHANYQSKPTKWPTLRTGIYCWVSRGVNQWVYNETGGMAQYKYTFDAYDLNTGQFSMLLLHRFKVAIYSYWKCIVQMLIILLINRLCIQLVTWQDM